MLVAKLNFQKIVFINCRNRFSLTPIFYAAQNGHNDVLKVLLKAGADPGAHDTNKAGFFSSISFHELKPVFV